MFIAGFILGGCIGAFIGIGLMCLLQIHRGSRR